MQKRNVWRQLGLSDNEKSKETYRAYENKGSSRFLRNTEYSVVSILSQYPDQYALNYEYAFYHAMYRGCAWNTIFQDELYYQVFLDTPAKAHERFHGINHAYCLVGTFYYLLLKTSNANLIRIMRHINGVYTQHYNCLK